MGISSRVTGIDFGHHSIKAVTLTPSSHHTYNVVACSELPVPDCIFADNGMLGYQKIVKKLKELKKTFPRFSRKVAITLSDSAIITKELQLDSYENPDEKLLAIMSEQCGILPEELAIDYLALPYEANLSGFGPTYRVFATRKTLINNRVKALKAAGLIPYLINSHSQGLLQLYQSLSRGSTLATSVLLYIGHKQATLCFCSQSQDLCFHTFSYAAFEPSASVVYPQEWLTRITPSIQRFQSLHMRAAPQCVWIAGIGSDDDQSVARLGRQLDWPCQMLSWNGFLHHVEHHPRCNARFAGAVGIAMQGLCWQRNHHA